MFLKSGAAPSEPAGNPSRPGTLAGLPLSASLALIHLSQGYALTLTSPVMVASGEDLELKLSHTDSVLVLADSVEKELQLAAVAESPTPPCFDI